MAAKGLRQGDTSAARAAQKGMPMTDAQYEEALVEDLARFYADPVGFLYYSFAWGQGELAGMEGPDKWQLEFFEAIAEKLRQDPDASIREATASGHGIGKTAVVAWLILWCMSTRPQMSGVVTANTMGQLSTKTWRELALWHKRLVHRHWFRWSATKFHHVQHPETWFTSATPNTEHSSEAFAGMHAKYVLLIFDEASAIAKKIWEVSEGAMSTPRAYWFVFGNPTLNSGRFKECFTTDKRRWGTRHVDSRTAKMTNKKELDEWIRAYGIESDFVKVRILGQFPSAGAMQMIPTGDVERAMLAEIPFEAWCHQPIVLGVDVARYGSDASAIAVRQGRKLHIVKRYREISTMVLCAKIVETAKEYGGAVAIFVDGVGVGAGVVDRLQMLGHGVIEVNGGATAFDEIRFYNKSAEMWQRMADWIKGGDMPAEDTELRLALTQRDYYYDTKERVQLERKADMRKRGLDSPDSADALCHTFAEEIGDVLRSSFEPTVSENSIDPE